MTDSEAPLQGTAASARAVGGSGVLPEPLRHVPAAGTSTDTGQTSGMTRREAVSGTSVGSQRVWMGQTHVAPGASSGNHHHGDTETAIYVVTGHPVFVFPQDGEEVRLTPEPGDYVFVPPFTPHREENPGDEEAVVVIARSSQEAVVVNLDGPLVGD
jgi:uncharacterized RmlC-like cupin family protein